MDDNDLLASRPLANPKHEHFAQLIVSGAKIGEAYKLAGMGHKASTVATQATVLKKKPEVAARIQYLQSVDVPMVYNDSEIQTVEEIFGITKKELVQKTLQIYTEAVDENEKRLALSAIELVHKMMLEEQKLWKEKGLFDRANKKKLRADEQSEETYEEAKKDTHSDLHKFVELISNSNSARQVVKDVEDVDVDD